MTIHVSLCAVEGVSQPIHWNHVIFQMFAQYVVILKFDEQFDPKNLIDGIAVQSQRHTKKNKENKLQFEALAHVMIKKKKTIGNYRFI